MREDYGKKAIVEFADRREGTAQAGRCTKSAKYLKLEARTVLKR